MIQGLEQRAEGVSAVKYENGPNPSLLQLFLGMEGQGVCRGVQDLTWALGARPVGPRAPFPRGFGLELWEKFPTQVGSSRGAQPYPPPNPEKKILLVRDDSTFTQRKEGQKEGLLGSYNPTFPFL